MDSADIVGKARRIEYLAEASDMDIDSARNDMKISAPHRLE
jgi:hypothetical protein